MRLRVLASGSGGNASLLWAGDRLVLLDAGLPVTAMTERLLESRVGMKAIDHVIVTHGHLDHSRTAGVIAKRQGATLHAPAEILEHRSLKRAPERRPLGVGVDEVIGEGADALAIKTALVPHDCFPTLALRLEQHGRVLSLLTDCGEPREDLGKALGGAHVLLIEANHDVQLLREGPYPQSLKDRVLGAGGHLSNDQMAIMLRRLLNPHLHTVVLLHLSAKNNRPEIARRVAMEALEQAGRSDVRVLCAEQDRPLEPLDI
ncbi:MAG: MBL fold metallo-hydrolase [Planctomycetota bacterium]|nr:MBL fold metallo-hydrolase [Planctomycetota bacterium]MDG1986121.1 MBL fold metallo-hydrolase [Planctomycetota bacterium]